MAARTGGAPGDRHRAAVRHLEDHAKRHAESCEAARQWLALPYVIDGVHVDVDDVDAHFAQARSSGATILSEPEDTGHGRSYRAADLEGHRWMFDQRPSAVT